MTIAMVGTSSATGEKPDNRDEVIHERISPGPDLLLNSPFPQPPELLSFPIRSSVSLPRKRNPSPAYSLLLLLSPQWEGATLVADGD
ncbi:hypothetical protein HPP92_000768 [Vanilla planifolia]|uniref:Uncharacterized protein n=1 Tax=Vanilla planifolia TaxID=51239 RepID=A0A835S221_VANPL|nr:hypothetical protein HPP92_000768 [Vanilla planifolia]